MPKLELSDRFCQSAKAGDGRKADFFDTTVAGLCLRVSAGGTKAWFLVYSKPGSRARAWLKLGTYPEIPLGGEKGARQRARGARAKVGEGADPLVERRAREAGQTVADLVENYLARKAAARRSADEIARRLRKNVSGRDGDP